MLPYLSALFVLLWQWNNQRCWRPVCWKRRLRKNVSTFLGKKCTPEKILATPRTPGDLSWGFSDLEMTWLLYGAGAAIVYPKFQEDYASWHTGCSYTDRPTEGVDALLSLAVNQSHKHLSVSHTVIFWHTRMPIISDEITYNNFLYPTCPRSRCWNRILVQLWYN